MLGRLGQTGRLGLATEEAGVRLPGARRGALPETPGGEPAGRRNRPPERRQ